MNEEITIEYIIDIKGNILTIYNPHDNNEKKISDIFPKGSEYTPYEHISTSKTFKIIQSKDSKKTLLFQIADGLSSKPKSCILICVDDDVLSSLKTEPLKKSNTDIDKIKQIIEVYIKLLLALSVKKSFNDIIVLFPAED